MGLPDRNITLPMNARALGCVATCLGFPPSSRVEPFEREPVLLPERDVRECGTVSVAGVPRNYLVDSETGEILATNVRGRHLDVRLEEILQ